MRRFVPVLILPGLLASVSPGCIPWVEETSSETITRAGVAELVVRLDHGSVSVGEHLGAEVEVEVRRSARAPSRGAAQEALEDLLVEFGDGEGSGRLVISSRLATAGAFRPWEQPDLRLRISVPAATAINVRTGSGRIELDGLTGAIGATTASGRIVARDLRSPFRPDGHPIVLRTADGSIEGENLEGLVHAETAEGSIRLVGRLQQVTALSADGRIEVIVAEGGAAREGRWFLRTADGSVRLRLPHGASARVSAVGEIADEDDDEEAPEWEREGPLALTSVGHGSGPHIRMRTGDGSIRLRIGEPD